jgi:replication factor A1
MYVSDLKPNQPVDSLILEIVNIGEPKEFTNFRGKIKVANAKAKDSTGECTLTLWNDEIDRYSPGQKIRIINGWCKEYRGEIQVSSGKYGKVEVLSGGSGRESKKEEKVQKKKQSPKKTQKKDVEESEEDPPADEDDIFSEAEKDPYIKYEKKYSKDF